MRVLKIQTPTVVIYTTGNIIIRKIDKNNIVILTDGREIPVECSVEEMTQSIDNLLENML